MQRKLKNETSLAYTIRELKKAEALTEQKIMPAYQKRRENIASWSIIFLLNSFALFAFDISMTWFEKDIGWLESTHRNFENIHKNLLKYLLIHSIICLIVHHFKPFKEGFEKIRIPLDENLVIPLQPEEKRFVYKTVNFTETRALCNFNLKFYPDALVDQLPPIKLLKELKRIKNLIESEVQKNTKRGQKAIVVLRKQSMFANLSQAQPIFPLILRYLDCPEAMTDKMKLNKKG